MSEIKNKKKYYFRKSRNKYFLEPGFKGFFCTCNFREKDCVKEAYNLLNEYANKLYPDLACDTTPKTSVDEEKVEDTTDEEIDIGDLLKREVENIKRNSQKSLKDKRFQAVETGASNCVFIKTNLPNPEELGTSIFNDLLLLKVQKTRHLLRLVPIMSTCKANLPDIMECAGKLFDKYFITNSCTFAVVFNKRFNNSVSRELVIKELADLVILKNNDNKADLKNPHYSIIVEIIKGMCLLSILKNYYNFKKYNLIEICKVDVQDDGGETHAKKQKTVSCTTADSTETTT